MPLPKIVHTKISPPSPGARTLPRPRVDQSLLESLQYRLTLLQAGAGYGKSTALGSLAEKHQPTFWYQVTQEDSDPLVFLLHLCHAIQHRLPELEGLPIPFLEAWDGSRGPLPSPGVVDQLVNALNDQLLQPALFILDDVHLVMDSPEIAHILDRVIGLAPYNLHILLAGRLPVKLPNLSRWRAQGEVLVLDQSLLAFTRDEIAALFSKRYGYELTTGEVEALFLNTEGWAIALQLIWQSLRSGSSLSIEASLDHQVSSLDSLFDILAREVFQGQPSDVQEFLLVSATLREMTVEACAALLNAISRDKARTCSTGTASQPESIKLTSSSTDPAAMLAYLRRQDLFVVDPGGGNLRYHHIFHQFLRQQAPRDQRQKWHLHAAGYYRQRKDLDSTIYHLLEAKDYDAAASLLDQYGSDLLAAGRLDTLAADLDLLPPETLHQHPGLLSYLGDLARLHSRFQEALGWYQQAERLWRDRNQLDGTSRALRGQARVYLDTVNPSKAEQLLQESLRLSDRIEDRQSQARLYELLAENKLNLGKVEQAEKLRQQAQALRSEGPSDSQLLFRVLLRTGRLEEARLRLEERAKAERQDPVHTPRAHRETLLLLSLIDAFQGLANQAYETAQEGTRRGIDLQSPFITAVGHMRQGHALMLLPGADRYRRARQEFMETIRISRMLVVPRLLVEAYWGLCRVSGYQGDLAQATQFAQEGLEIANQAGDEWIASLVRLSLGASLVLYARYEAAQHWLERAAMGFEECSDPFGRAAARLWLCLAWFQEGNFNALSQTLPDVLACSRQRGYDFLFTRPTLLGPADERILAPMLIYARDQDWEQTHVQRLLAAMGLPDIQIHPGFQLRATTLGSFQVARGEQAIPNNGWRREKSRQLFQLLLTYRNAPLDREQIIEYLWPDQDLASAQRNFKVTLSTLYQVLEPEREAGSESAYVIREGTVYNLRPGADLWLDAQVFEDTLERAESLSEEDPEAAIDLLQEALRLYQGEYLPDARYETWAAGEREHLAVLFLRSADRLSELHLSQEHWEETIDICQRILSFDNCWERAYRHLMLAFYSLGDRGQTGRAYQRCVQTLRAELDVAPSPETEALYKRLTA
ncbi:MAG: BTAD domain-containing putative transcriptional regulator [Anaerolineales bacterium]